MAQVYTVTASTSVVLISTLTAPNSIVLLSSIRYAGHIVGIRDTTNDPLIAHYPVIVSTMSGLTLYDGTSSLLLNQPNGFVSLASRDTRTWQLLNSKGFLTTLSNSFLETLTTQSVYLRSMQSASESISSVTAGKVEVLSSIQVLGTTNLQGDVTITGSFDVFSTLRAFQNVSLSSGLIVGGNVTLPSSLSIRDDLQVGSNLSTTQNLFVADNLLMDTSLVVQGALLPPFVSVQTLYATTLQVGGGLLTAGGISTTNLSVGKDVVALGTGLFQNGITNLGMMSMYDDLMVGGGFKTQDLLVREKGSVASFVNAGTLTASGSLSTLGSISVAGRFVGSNDGLVEGELQVLSTTQIQDLHVLGSATISSLAIYGRLQSEGEASSWSSTFVASAELDVRGPLILGSQLQAPLAYLSVTDTLSTLTSLSIYDSLYAQGVVYARSDSYLGGDVTGISTLFVSSNVSTLSLSAQGELFVDGSLYVNQVASASTLGAPIGLQISTLTLSNTLTIDTYGYVPELQLFSYPDRMAAGASPQLENYDLAIDGVLQNRLSVFQTSGDSPSKRWYAKTLRLSTLSGLSNLSAAVIGPTTFEYPLTDAQGLLVVGSNAETTSNIYYGFSPSTLFVPAKGSFGTRGSKVAYGSNLWVAVGIGSSATQAIQYSADGYNWNTIASGGFPTGGRGIAYGSGTWIAVGAVGPGPYTQATIQRSGNGITWSNAGGAVFNAIAGAGIGVAYNGSNLWVAVGSDPGVGGIKYSGTGATWSNPILIPPNTASAFVSVGFGNGLWLASDGATLTYSSSNGIQWFLVATAVPRLAYSYVTANGGGFWIGGGSNVGGNPLTTIQISPNGSNWLPIQTGGFQLACSDLVQFPGLSTFVAVGIDAAPTTTILQYSSNLQNWIPNDVFRGSGYGIGLGRLIAPSGRPLFTANVTSIFHSNVSVATLYASSIKASSVFGSYSADGSNLSRVGTYTSSVRVSSMTTTTLNTFEVSTNRFFGTLVSASDSIQVPRTTFFSTGNLFLAAGSDSLETGNIQTSVNGTQWSRTINSNFAYYGNAIAGNSNQGNPLFVAAGADSRTAYTLQYSGNGRVWYPATSGGFSYATDVGIREGSSVAYSSNLNLWVAVGKSLGSTNTILYSSDGSNWSEASGGFQDYGTSVKVQGSNFVAFGNGVRWSSNGTEWYPSGLQPAFTAIAYGTFISGPTSLDAWIGIATSNIYTSVNNGLSWSLTAQTTSAPVSDIVYKNNLWLAVGSNVIQASITGFTWSPVTTSFSSNVNFNSVSYSSNANLWIAGAQSPTNTQTLWTSQTGYTWSAITSGGFSTSVESFGVGYGVFSLAQSTLAVGVSALDINLNLLPSILLLSTNAGVGGSTITTLSLTASNASNVFSTSVRGLWGTTDEFYKFIAVGDGITPQKTIARSIDATPGSWLPAITGGFSTTGYNVTYANNKWFAVGDAAISTNVIQYSPDGANWFGTNTAPGLRQGGRGIAVGIGSLSETLVAVGKDITTSSIVYTGNGINWSNATSGYFNVQGNGVAAGSNGSAANFVAVGQDTRDATNTILTSTDGISWTTIASGGFSVAGYGAAWSIDLNRWVAVGQDADSNKTIQYSGDGGVNFTAATNSFTSAGYGVTYNSSIGIFFAVGKDVNGDSPQTIKYSGDGITWENFSTGSGFISQKSLGTANGVFVQPILTKETTPYIEFSNLIVYERDEPFLYFKPSIRVQSTFVSFNESLFVNTSSQVSIGSNLPIGIADVSVYGTTYTSSLLYRGIVPLPSTLYVSSMIVSTFSTIGTIQAKTLRTPSLSINAPSERTANSISSIGKAAYDLLAVNNALFVPAGGSELVNHGIRNQDPFYTLDVQGPFGTSTLSSVYHYAPQNIYVSASRIYFQDDYLNMVEGSVSVPETHSVRTTPSSMTFNSIFTLQVSTQRVGVFTTNPQVDFDVQRLGYLGSLQANAINTSLLFLTLQSV
jgi:hypothetical protein